MSLELNQRAAQLVSQAVTEADRLRIAVCEHDEVTLLDFGVECLGGLDAGILLARVCMSDLADIRIVPGDGQLPVPQVYVTTDHPIAACLLSQYAGWKIATADYFAMGSGPMRILAQVEELQKEFDVSENGSSCIGVLEASTLPSKSAIELIRDSVETTGKIALLTAPTASIAGSVQIVARSIETALHKLHDLRFPLETIVSGAGISPLPPIAKNDLEGIGRTNDAILYGATVNLWVDCDDELIQSTGPLVPSASSESHGRTFQDLFTEADNDFYRLDPKLFSPAVVLFHNLNSGRSFGFGHRMPDLVTASFGLDF
ncbi:MAG: methenyltetrahydromethanopterin cyclohydrolase [Fuerstiella sp.]|nr:methenyltetrahydromethanopterin cyclohydrolase [Fuerstiella sp.]